MSSKSTEPTETPAVLLRLSCHGKTFLEHRNLVVEDADIDRYGYEDRPQREIACVDDDESSYPEIEYNDDDDTLSNAEYGDLGWDTEYVPSFLDTTHATATDRRNGRHDARSGTDVHAPAVVARGDAKCDIECACCGANVGSEQQMPWNVFQTAYRAKVSLGTFRDRLGIV